MFLKIINLKALARSGCGWAVSNLRTPRWRELESNHRSLSYDRYS
jgi:hypothetical protein